jgi:prepilin-type N-terminal cleavage/methylation domain-containing protein
MAGLGRTRRNPQGFSLAEVVLALVLLGLLSAGASSLVTSALGTSNAQRDQMIAHLLAARELETALAGGYGTLPAGTRAAAAVAGFPQYTARLSVAQQGADLRWVRVTVSGPAAADSLETLIANRS